MHISLPHDAEMLAKNQAAAAGFNSIDDYVANLIRRQSGRVKSSTRERAFQELRQLRKELPKLSPAEIVRSVLVGSQAGSGGNSRPEVTSGHFPGPGAQVATSTRHRHPYSNAPNDSFYQTIAPSAYR